ncbi:hypothetical protein [Methanofollis ethanolicus]|uniref:hypothetical protein n=1 Tax=Methanofollis ethanolicus TaxID=488124 RepID=UPI00083303DE|nr:hypothetical protein [Methanofollis ethanolicus]
MNTTLSVLLALCCLAVSLTSGCATAPVDRQTPVPTTVVTPTPTLPVVESPVLVVDPRLSEMTIDLSAVERSDGSGVTLKLATDPVGAAIARDGVDVLVTFFAYNAAEKPGFVPSSADEVRKAGIPYKTVFFSVYDAPVRVQAELPRESEQKNLQIGEPYVYGAVVMVKD